MFIAHTPPWRNRRSGAPAVQPSLITDPQALAPNAPRSRPTPYVRRRVRCERDSLNVRTLTKHPAAVLNRSHLISHLNMLNPIVLLLATIAQSASCSPASAADYPALSSSYPVPSSPDPNDPATLDILGSEVGQTTLGKRNGDAALRSNARKRGVAWQLGSSGTLAPFNTLPTYYTYGPNAYNTSENGPAFVPQLWGCSDAHVDEFQARMGAEWAIAGSDRGFSLQLSGRRIADGQRKPDS